MRKKVVYMDQFGPGLKEEEVGCILKDAPIVVGVGVVAAASVNAKRLGVFMDFLKYSKRVKEAGSEYPR